MVDLLTLQLTIISKMKSYNQNQWLYSALGMTLVHGEQKNMNTKRTIIGTNLDTRNRLYYFH